VLRIHTSWGETLLVDGKDNCFLLGKFVGRFKKRKVEKDKFEKGKSWTCARNLQNSPVLLELNEGRRGRVSPSGSCCTLKILYVREQKGKPCVFDSTASNLAFRRASTIVFLLVTSTRMTLMRTMLVSDVKKIFNLCHTGGKFHVPSAFLPSSIQFISQCNCFLFPPPFEN
jgi:hypothetical protein